MIDLTQLNQQVRIEQNGILMAKRNGIFSTNTNYNSKSLFANFNKATEHIILVGRHTNVEKI